MYALPDRRRGVLPGRTGRRHPSRPAGPAAPQWPRTPRPTRCGCIPAGRCSSRCPSGSPRTSRAPRPMHRPAGDVAFHAIRPYQYGDDPRHIHWMSTARTGSVMVRHYVDNRRPNLGVAVRHRSRGVRRRAVRDGVEIVASMMLSSLAGRLPVTAVTAATGCSAAFARRPRHDPRTPHRRPAATAVPSSRSPRTPCGRARHERCRRHRRPPHDRRAPARDVPCPPARPSDRGQREGRRGRRAASASPAHGAERRLARRVPRGVGRDGRMNSGPRRRAWNVAARRARARGGDGRRGQGGVLQHVPAVELPRRPAIAAPRCGRRSSPGRAGSHLLDGGGCRVGVGSVLVGTPCAAGLGGSSAGSLTRWAELLAGTPPTDLTPSCGSFRSRSRGSGPHIGLEVLRRIPPAGVADPRPARHLRGDDAAHRVRPHHRPRRGAR